RTRRATSPSAASVAAVTTTATKARAASPTPVRKRSPTTPSPTIPTKPPDHAPQEHAHVQVLPPPQVLQVHRRGCQGDRLQGSQHPAPVPHRDRQDRAVARDRYQVEVPAPAGNGRQARPFPRADPVHRQPQRLIDLPVIRTALLRGHAPR